MRFNEFYNDNEVTLYHGTLPKHVQNIKSNGLESPKGYHDAQWYMLSTDFDSALFHAVPKDDSSVFVAEFKIPFEENDRWEGYPYLWPANKRDDKSRWYALKQPIPKEFLVDIHEVSNEDYAKQKLKGF